MKKAVITILGTAGSSYNRETKLYEAKEEKAEYTLLDGTKKKFHNTFFLLNDFYEKDYEIVAIYTEEAKQAHKAIIGNSYKDIRYTFDEKYLIKNSNDNKDIFKIINTALKKYNEVIFDVSHGFRHLPILATIALMVEHIENTQKIKQILFAQEVVPFKSYKMIDLKNYLNISSTALTLQTFLSTFKVPSFDDNSIILYGELKEFSTHLISNQFSTIFDEDIPKLQKMINEKKAELFYVDTSLLELKNFIEKLTAVKSKNEYEKFIFFSELFLEKEYLLHSATYLIESITYYISFVFKKKNYIDFDITKYDNQQKIVNLLRFNIDSEMFKFPNEYFIDINYKVIKQFSELRNKIADIRHNLAHISITKEYGDIQKDLKDYITELNSLVAGENLYNLDKTENLIKQTVRYKLEEYKKTADKCLNANAQNGSKIETLYEKWKAGNLATLNLYNSKNLEKFCQKNMQDIGKLLDLIKNNIYLMEDTNPQVIAPDEKIMPNGEKRVVKSLKKKKEKIIQTDEDKKILKDGSNKLSDFFSKR